MDSSPNSTKPSPGVPLTVTLISVFLVLTVFLYATVLAVAPLDLSDSQRSRFQFSSIIWLNLFFALISWYIRQPLGDDASPEMLHPETASHAEFPPSPDAAMQSPDEPIPINPYGAPKSDTRSPPLTDDRTADLTLVAGVLGSFSVGLLCRLLGPLLIANVDYRLLMLVANLLSLSVSGFAWVQYSRQLARRRLKRSTAPPPSTDR